MNKTIVPDIECNLSYNFLPISNCSIESYLGCLVPLRARCQKNCNNQYIFEPIFNNLEHFGLQYGTTISLFLYQNDERVIKFVFGNNLLYLFPGNEFRSFDLQGRPWSRYLYAYNNFQLKNQSLEPLVNFLSFECRVSPNFSNIATSELHYIKGNFNFAVGYSLFARQSESVTILEDLPNIVLQGTDLNTNILVCPPVSIIRDIGLRLSNEDVQTREIDFNSNDLYFNANYFYAKINNTMIDISSATHPAVFSGELYCKTKIYINEMFDFFLGSSYKFSHNNAAIEYITLWIGFQSCF
jgi:hypothetical protein